MLLGKSYAFIIPPSKGARGMIVLSAEEFESRRDEILIESGENKSPTPLEWHNRDISLMNGMSG
jgi:hypothetical protein